MHVERFHPPTLLESTSIAQARLAGDALRIHGDHLLSDIQCRALVTDAQMDGRKSGGVKLPDGLQRVGRQYRIVQLKESQRDGAMRVTKESIRRSVEES